MNKNQFSNLFKNVMKTTCILFITLISSCTYDVINPQNSSSLPEVKNGRIAFDAVSTFMNEAKDLDINDFAAQIHTLEGENFSSLMPLFGELEENKLES
jgi:hypothetical protein